MEPTSFLIARVHTLYVTDTRHGHQGWLDPSARHRVYHYADGLAAAGYRVQVAHIESVTATLANSVDHIIFHRPKLTSRFVTAFESCRRSRAILHADYDDLIFDSEFAQHSPLYLNGNRPLSKVVDYFQHNQQAAERFDHFVVSTRFLADHLKKTHPQALVTTLPNSLPRLFNPPVKKSVKNDIFTIGYFPGSNSHGHDLNMITDALIEFQSRNPKSRMVIAGQFNMADIKSPGLVVEQLPYMDYDRYLGLLSKVDVSIAPLESNPFNLAKSAVKLIESVAVSTPILVSPNPDMEDHNNSLSTIVKSPADWAPALEAVVANDHGIDIRSDITGASQYCVSSRLPILEGHLRCAA